MEAPIGEQIRGRDDPRYGMPVERHTVTTWVDPGTKVTHVCRTDTTPALKAEAGPGANKSENRSSQPSP